jgi:hypothetical protein
VGVDIGRASEVPEAAEEVRGSAGGPAAVVDAVSHKTHSPWYDVCGVLWVLAAAGAALLPTLVRGSYFGAFGSLSTYGLTARSGVVIHNGVAADQVTEVLPWIQMAWTQVHHGHLPLWNTQEALGMPLAFNWGSGAFSLPALVSYLTPLRVVYWVQIVVSFVVGGTGAYFFGRVLRLHPVACAFAGTTWVLSGPAFGYLGLPDTAVMSWAGWQFAATLLIMRGTRRVWAIVLLAVSVAFSILAGNAQIELVILLALGTFIVIVLLCRVTRDGARAIRRPIADLAFAFVVGGALAAPLALPGLQLARASVRNVSPYGGANPISQLLSTIFQTYWAVRFYPEEYVWVGALAVVLAIVAVVIHWRRPAVVGMAAAVVVTAAASFFGPADRLLNALPLVGHAWWARSLIPLAFLLSMLGGIGLDTVVRSPERVRARQWALGGFGVMAVMLGMIWLFGRGGIPANAAHGRAESFVWPAVLTALGLVTFATLVVLDRQSVGHEGRAPASRWLTLVVAGSLLIGQTVFLVAIDSPLPASDSNGFQTTPGVTALQRAAGSSLVGLAVTPPYGIGLNLGIPPDANTAFGIDEFAEYDPIAPLNWFDTWYAINKTSPGWAQLYEFTPGIGSATMSRRYGISYVLTSAGAPGPEGSVFDTRVGNEYLYRIPGAATATLVSPAPSGGWPSIDAPGKPVSITRPTPSQVRVVTDASSPQVLRLRVASFPGWQATIDGHPLALATYLSMMFQAHIPPGRHVIVLRYWPNRFTQGLVLAAIAAVALVVMVLIAWRRSRRADVSQPV